MYRGCLLERAESSSLAHVRNDAVLVPRCAVVVTLLLVVFLVSRFVLAQPDPRQMSGIPLPDPQLAAGTITVRVIRGQLTNNVLNHPVELRHGDNIVTVNTDGDGRAQFLTLNPGAMVVAATELDGVQIDSQPFPVPGRGGIRLMLVGASGDPVIPSAQAEPGRVTFGSDSRVVLELGEETLSVFYLFDVVNSRNVPVEPEMPVSLTLPSGAVSTTVMRDSSPRTRSEGTRVTLPGPFPPGGTPLRVAYVLPYSGGSVLISQELPIDLDALLLIVEEWGAMDVVSTQIERRADMTPDSDNGGTYIFAAGPPIPSGTALSFEVVGLPHHSRLPSMLALAIAFVIIGVGVWVGAVPVDKLVATERRRRLELRRETSYTELVRLEQQHRSGKVGAVKYANRRRELFAILERLYVELDDEVVPFVFSSARSVAVTSSIPGPSSTTG